MKKKILTTVLIIIITAIVSILVTYNFMIYTAQPDVPCSITWCGSAHNYK
jgi:hypothetical protein